MHVCVYVLPSSSSSHPVKFSERGRVRREVKSTQTHDKRKKEKHSPPRRRLQVSSLRGCLPREVATHTHTQVRVTGGMYMGCSRHHLQTLSSVTTFSFWRRREGGAGQRRGTQSARARETRWEREDARGGGQKTWLSSATGTAWHTRRQPKMQFYRDTGS